MASLEPPVPAIVADNFGGSSAMDTESGTDGMKKKGFARFGKAGKRTVGLLMLAIVVFLWTASNFLASVSGPARKMRRDQMDGRLTRSVYRRTSWPTTRTASPSSSPTSIRPSLSFRSYRYWPSKRTRSRVNYSNGRKIHWPVYVQGHAMSRFSTKAAATPSQTAAHALARDGPQTAPLRSSFLGTQWRRLRS